MVLLSISLMEVISQKNLKCKRNPLGLHFVTDNFTTLSGTSFMSLYTEKVEGAVQQIALRLHGIKRWRKSASFLGNYWGELKHLTKNWQPWRVDVVDALCTTLLLCKHISCSLVLCFHPLPFLKRNMLVHCKLHLFLNNI